MARLVLRSPAVLTFNPDTVATFVGRLAELLGVRLEDAMAVVRLNPMVCNYRIETLR